MDQPATSSTCDDSPNENGLNTTDKVAIAPATSPWTNLPSVILSEVFSLLNDGDRRNAADVCRHWRENYFQPRWFGSNVFCIEPNDKGKSRFFADTFGTNVQIAYIILYSLSNECIKELIYLLHVLMGNNNLKSLYIKPFHNSLQATAIDDRASTVDLAEVENTLIKILPRLHNIDISCVKELKLSAKNILDSFNFSIKAYLICDLESVKVVVVTRNAILLVRETQKYYVLNRTRDEV